MPVRGSFTNHSGSWKAALARLDMDSLYSFVLRCDTTEEPMRVCPPSRRLLRKVFNNIDLGSDQCMNLERAIMHWAWCIHFFDVLVREMRGRTRTP